MKPQEPKYEVGQTLYFEDDPEPGVVQEIVPIGENHRYGPGYLYRLTFANGPEDWPGFQYAEGCLFPEPTAPWQSEF